MREQELIGHLPGGDETEEVLSFIRRPVNKNKPVIYLNRRDWNKLEGNETN
jgi:hypothetical protein